MIPKHHIHLFLEMQMSLEVTLYNIPSNPDFLRYLSIPCDSGESDSSPA